MNSTAMLVETLHFEVLDPVVKHVLGGVDRMDRVSWVEFLHFEVVSTDTVHTEEDVFSSFLDIFWNFREIDLFKKVFNLLDLYVMASLGHARRAEFLSLLDIPVLVDCLDVVWLVCLKSHFDDFFLRMLVHLFIKSSFVCFFLKL